VTEAVPAGRACVRPRSGYRDPAATRSVYGCVALFVERITLETLFRNLRKTAPMSLKLLLLLKHLLLQLFLDGA